MAEHDAQHDGFAFRALRDHRAGRGTSKILNFPKSSDPLESSQEQATRNAAHFRGALLRLFGDPLHVSARADAAVAYAIRATAPDGQSWVLTAYEGPSGPAIGGPSQAIHPSAHQGAIPAAEALMRLLEQTSPADFDAIVYDDDTNYTVFYGCRSGETYYRQMRGKHLRKPG